MVSFRTAGTGPMPMMRGATPAVAVATTRAPRARQNLAHAMRGVSERQNYGVRVRSWPAKS